MPADLHLSRAVARRYLAIRQLLAPARSLPPEPASVLAVVGRLGTLQFDPIEIAGRNHDLVLLARIAGYRRDWTDALLYDERVLFEAYNKGLSILPVAELPFYRVSWDANRTVHDETTFVEHAELVAELLDRIGADGPLAATDVERRGAIEWYWRPTNQVRAILEALAEAGVLGIRRRDGNRRVYDLAERLYPPGLLAVRPPVRDQRRHKLRSRYVAHGLLGRGGSAELFLGTAPAVPKPEVVPFTRGELLGELLEAGELVAVTVEGVRGERYVPSADLVRVARAEREIASEGEPGPGRFEIGEPGGAGPTVAFVAPLDPLAWDRALLASLHDFEYTWEVYVPEAKRRYGWYVLPILYGDRLVGRIEPRLERRERTLRIAGLWWEDGFDPLADPRFVPAFVAALDAHRAFGDAIRIAFPRVARHRAFVGAVRARLGARPASATA